MRGALEAQTIDILPQSRLADVKTIDEAARTVELIFSTGAAVERYDWRTGSRYIEKLSMEPAHVRLGRLNEGAPLLDAHSAWSVSDILGSVVRGTAKVASSKAIATVKFSARQAVEEIWRDVKDGVISAVSVGYRIHRFEETASTKEGGLPTRLATLWEPYEISLVPMPADTGARVRGELLDANRCLILPAPAARDRDLGLRIRIAQRKSFAI